ncbi:MAG: hypothetical protein KAS32_29280, partial [Candidatus Peribacteraceae bacterium]|nr:hypothetical protein [Candidatus Peribacteraceae bacterium]
TKDRTVTPTPSFEGSVADFNTEQKTDYYMFVSLLRQGQKYIKGFITGFMRKDLFYKTAVFHKKGDRDDSNDFTFTADCYNIPYSKLRQVTNNKIGETTWE